ncbi:MULTISPECIES: hypothetical protein [Pseudomonas]|uniref:hypothetical protein n=1 Tax=Pseudomonas TaxID=286 RepID=UPI000F03A105|nr:MULTISPECIES: hypothetical protein [Pseudomonas]MBD8681611.1 hypothetical protein [Pseudomonas sp. CFBP 13719]
MASDIKFTYRNKAYITQLVNALAEGDVTTLANRFSQHADPLVYKQTKDSLKPTDYALLLEIRENFTAFTELDVHALLLALSSEEPLSTKTRVALYMVSYPHLSTDDRDCLFGDSGPLAITSEDLANLKATQEQPGSDLDSWEKSRLRSFYEQSVVVNQSPEDFVAKFKICEAIGLPLYVEINRLAYQDQPGGPSALDRYKQIFAEVGEENTQSFVWNMRKPAISYELLKEYGFKAFHDAQHDRGFQLKFIPDAFDHDEPEIFQQLTERNIPHISVSQVLEITKEMVSRLGEVEPSKAQSEMLAFMDEHLSKIDIERIQDRVASHAQSSRFGRLDPILDIVASGNERMLDAFIRHVGEDRVAPHLSAMMPLLEKYLPRMARGNDISESQKRMALRLHEMASVHTAEIGDVLQGIDTSKAYRLREENGVDVKLAFSEMSGEQRAQWAHEIVTAAPEESKRSYRGGRFFDPF